MFCKMIAKDFKKLEGKWTYKVFMVGGAVFYEAPCNRPWCVKKQDTHGIEDQFL